MFSEESSDPMRDDRGPSAGAVDSLVR